MFIIIHQMTLYAATIFLYIWKGNYPS